MSQPLFERYKEALRRGHVAALRGSLEVSLAAYEEAAELAPDRALPHTSLGTVLHRAGRLPAALGAFDQALARAPLEEVALRGRAAVLLDLGRRVEAADEFGRLAEALESDGRLADARDAARRSLEIAESRTRRRLADRLAALVRDPGATAAGVDTLEPGAPLSEALPLPPATVAEPPTDPLLLAGRAEALIESGDIPAARDLLLAAASGHRAAGHLDAAFDACLTLLALTPADPELTLLIADLELDRGWDDVATEKLRLLRRLTRLMDDEAGASEVGAAAEARLVQLGRQAD